MSPILLLLACSEPVPVAPDDPTLLSIAVQPANLALRTSPEGGQGWRFTAQGTWDDGRVEELERVEWALSNRSVGSIDEDGLFSPSTANGGVTWVKARLAGVEGLSELRVLFEQRLDGEGVDPALFSGDSVDTVNLWLYPEDGVNVPRNTPGITFMWQDAGAQAYELRFRSAITDVRATTTATSWTADEATWQNIVATNAGGELTVELLANVNGSLVADSPITIHVNRMDGRGSIYYWSTTAQGIMRIPYGQAASPFLTVTETGRCVACHAVSDAGQIATTFDGGNGTMVVQRTDTLEPIIPPDQVRGNFKTFSPGGDYLLATYAGALLLYDGHTGAFLHEVATGRTATHVDWSPDGTRVVMVLTGGHSADWVFTGGEIAVMAHVGGGQFSTPEVIVPGGQGWNNYYPAWSPDSAWIAFNRSTGDAYDDPDAEVWVVAGEGGAPVRLDAANQVGALANSWPRWGPLPDDDVLWVAFASRRAYGWQAVDRPQIWVAGFDPARAAAGEDPSWPAFWLPNQDTGANNHIPIWAQ